MSLYNIAQELLAFEEMLLLDQGEMTEAHEQLLTEFNSWLSTKTDSIVWLSCKLEDEIAMADLHSKRIALYKKARVNAVERLRQYVTQQMDIMQTDKIKGELGEISIRKPVKVLHVEDANLVPVEFTKVKVELDDAKIKGALKNGTDVSGARLIDGQRLALFKMKSVKD